MLAKHDVAVRIGMILLPGLLYAMPAASEGIAIRAAHRARPTNRNCRRRPWGTGSRPLPIFRRTCRKTRRIIEREKRDRELDAKLRICRNC